MLTGVALSGTSVANATEGGGLYHALAVYVCVRTQELTISVQCRLCTLERPSFFVFIVILVGGLQRRRATSPIHSLAFVSGFSSGKWPGPFSAFLTTLPVAVCNVFGKACFPAFWDEPFEISLHRIPSVDQGVSCHGTLASLITASVPTQTPQNVLARRKKTP